MQDGKPEGRTLTAEEAAQAARSGAALGKTMEQIAAEAGAPSDVLRTALEHGRMDAEFQLRAADLKAEREARISAEKARLEAEVRAEQRRALAERVLVALAGAPAELAAGAAADYAVNAADELIRRLGEGK